MPYENLKKELRENNSQLFGWFTSLNKYLLKPHQKMCYRVKRNVEEYGCTDVNIFPLVENNLTTCHAAQSYPNTPELVLD